MIMQLKLQSMYLLNGVLKDKKKKLNFNLYNNFFLFNNKWNYLFYFLLYLDFFYS